jgi:hypothetical protein
VRGSFFAQILSLVLVLESPQTKSTGFRFDSSFKLNDNQQDYRRMGESLRNLEKNEANLKKT